MKRRRRSSARSPRRFERLVRALLPALIAAAVVAVSAAVRVTTPVSLDVVARSVTFSVPRGGDVQLLSNLTDFTSLLIEGCDSVRFPPLVVTLADARVIQTPATTFRCDARVPGSKVIIRLPKGDGVDDVPVNEVGEPAPRPARLGSIDSILARAGDRVTLELTSAKPVGVRLDLAGEGFDVSLLKEVPFEIVAEYANVDDGLLPLDPDGVAVYSARLAGSAVDRQARVGVRSRLNIVVERAGEQSFFVRGVNAPVESLSLFQRDDTTDAMVSTAIGGTLYYRGVEAKSVSIEPRENIRFPEGSGFRLIALGLETEEGGLSLRVEGNAAELSIGNEDRRLRLFDLIVSDATKTMLALVAVVGGQLIWLRDLWWPGRRRR